MIYESNYQPTSADLEALRADREMEKLEERLKVQALFVAQKVNNVNCFVSKMDIETLHSLEQKVGKKWDAINRGWMPLED